HGGGLSHPGGAALLLRPDRRRRQYPARRNAAEFPDHRIHQAVRRLPRDASAQEDRVARRARHPVEGTRPRRRASGGCLRGPSLVRTTTASVDGAASYWRLIGSRGTGIATIASPPMTSRHRAGSNEG